MNKSRQIVNNAAWIIGGKVIQSALGIVITMLTARYLGPANYGLINYASSLVAFVAPLAKLGLDSILVNELIHNPEEEGEILGTSILMSVFSSLICIAGLIFFTCIANAGESITIIVCALYSIVLLANAVELIQYWFQAHLLSKYTSIATLAAYTVKSAYQIILLIRGSSIYWFAVTSAFDVFVIAAIILWLYKKKTGQKLSVSATVAKRMFTQSKHYIVSSMMVTIFANTDRIMINMMQGDAQTGFYSAAVTCAGLSAFVFSAIIDSMRPSILESKKSNEKNYINGMTTLYAVIMYLSLAQCIVITFLSPVIVDVLYGSEYIPSVNALRIIVWYTTFSYLGAVRNVWILAENKYHLLWRVNTIGALANVVLNLIMIPIWGINGAALASLITQIMTNVVLCYIIRELRPTIELMKNGLDVRHMLATVKTVLRK